MKSIFFSMPSKGGHALQQLLICGILTLMSISTIQAQDNLLEAAFKLEKFYKKLDTDSTAAEAFFKELKKTYDIEKNITAAKLNEAFSRNGYLDTIVNYVYQKVKERDNVKDTELEELVKKRKSHYLFIIDSASIYCQKDIQKTRSKKNTPLHLGSCYFQIELNNLKRSTTITNLDDLIDKIKDEKGSFADTLIKIRDKINEASRRIYNLRNEAENVLSFNNQFNSIIPIGSSFSGGNSSLSSIIIKQEGAGSIQNSVIDGASKWIAERMRQELSIAFFERFEDWMKNQNIRVLFPNTHNALKSSENTDYSMMLRIFKAAFEKDLRAISFNIFDFLALELSLEETRANQQKKLNNARIERQEWQVKYDSILKIREKSNPSPSPTKNTNTIQLLGNAFVSPTSKITEQLSSIKRSIDSVQQKINLLKQNQIQVLEYILFTAKGIHFLSEGQHPTALLTYLSEEIDHFLPEAENVKASLILLDVISRSFISPDKDGKKVWAPSQTFERLRSKPQVQKIYFGLIYQEVKQIIDAKKNEVIDLRQNHINRNILNDQKNQEIDSYLFLVEDFIETMTNDFIINVILGDPLYVEGFLKGDQQKFDTLIHEISVKELKINSDLDKKLIDHARKNANLAIDSLLHLFQRITLNADTFNTNRWATLLSLKEKEKKKIIDILNTNNFSLNSNYSFEEMIDDLTFIPEDELPDTSLSLNKIRTYKKILTPIYLKEIKDYPLNQNDANFLMKKIDYFIDINIEEYIFRNQLNLIFKPDSATIKNTELYFINSADSALRNDFINKDTLAWFYLNRLASLDSAQLFIDQLLLGNDRHFGRIIGSFFSFANRMDEINAEISQLREQDKANFGSTEYVYLIRSSLETFNQAYTIALPNDELMVNTVMSLSASLLDAYTAVLDKDFDAVVMNIFPVIDSIMALSLEQEVLQIETQIKALEIHQDTSITKKIKQLKEQIKTKEKQKKGNIKQQVSLLQQQIKIQENKLDTVLRNGIAQLQESKALKKEKGFKNRRNLQEIFRYATFLAAVVESKNADEIKNAINAIALPVGSASIKRRSIFNISLNTYPGLTGGMERVSINNQKDWAVNGGFTAPVGFSINWGYKAKIKAAETKTSLRYQRRLNRSPWIGEDRYMTGQSGSIFISVIDLAAPVLFRLGNTEAPLPEGAYLKNLFSPGIMYAHGIGRLPVSILAGVSWSPKLRKFGDERANSLRLNVSAVFDLPIANLYTRSAPRTKHKKKKK